MPPKPVQKVSDYKHLAHGAAFDDVLLLCVTSQPSKSQHLHCDKADELTLIQHNIKSRPAATRTAPKSRRCQWHTHIYVLQKVESNIRTDSPLVPKINAELSSLAISISCICQQNSQPLMITENTNRNSRAAASDRSRKTDHSAPSYT